MYGNSDIAEESEIKIETDWLLEMLWETNTSISWHLLSSMLSVYYKFISQTDTKYF